MIIYLLPLDLHKLHEVLVQDLVYFAWLSHIRQVSFQAFLAKIFALVQEFRCLQGLVRDDQDNFIDSQ